MRIIAGQFRGRKLLPPKSQITRPITDRVKQSLFDILTPALPDANIYDLFAGTGSIGLECLSRGSRHVTFFESDRSAASILKKNIENLNATNLSTIITQDLFKWFASSRGHQHVHLVFLDPPYRFLRQRSDDLGRLCEHLLSHVTATGTIIFRHDSSDTLALPSLHPYDVREYGSMTIELLGKQ